METLENYLRHLKLTGFEYFFVTGICFFVFYFMLKGVLANKKIQKRFPKINDYLREIGYSVLTLLIFSAVPVIFIDNEKVSKFTTLYANISDYGPLYFWAAFPIMLLMHDTYFYWMHRLMHHKKLFKLFHVVHHQSTNPSPWATYSFHPLEAFTEVGILVIFLFTLPIHRLHFFIYFMNILFHNVYIHLGWELYPKNFNKTKIGKWINTSVGHNQHHQYFKGNYGLSFLFWDRWMGTLREDYDTPYDNLKSR